MTFADDFSTLVQAMEESTAGRSRLATGRGGSSSGAGGSQSALCHSLVFKLQSPATFPFSKTLLRQPNHQLVK